MPRWPPTCNVNTPGYQRVDVDFHTALRNALETGGDTRAAVERTSFAAERDATAVTRADGNGVDSDTASWSTCRIPVRSRSRRRPGAGAGRHAAGRSHPAALAASLNGV